jgi:integration host factor subunit alpha
MSETITRIHLASCVGKQVDVSVAESAKMVDAIFEEMSVGLKKDEVVKIPFFGSFYVRKKSQRMGRNPKTKIDAVIEPRNAVSFYASNKLKVKINNNKKD